MNYGTANLFAGGNTSFTAAGGLQQAAGAATLNVAAGQTLNLGGAGLTLDGTLTLAGNLNATDELINGVLTQTDGRNNASGTLTLASSGTYNLAGGSLSVDIYNLMPGGNFNQTGGSFHYNSLANNGGSYSFTDFYVGQNAGDNNSFSLDSGTFTANNAYIGYAGTGTFTQTGGTNTVSNTLTLAANSGSSGTYALSGGSLAAGYQLTSAMAAAALYPERRQQRH